MALDPDSGAILRYSLDMESSEARSGEGRLIQLTEYDWSSMFSVAETTGVISVTGKDMELLQIYRASFLVPAKPRQEKTAVACKHHFLCQLLLIE